jgi:transposase
MVSHTFWSPKKRAIAVTLRKEGYTYRQVAERLGGNATFSAVRKLFMKFNETQAVTDRPRTGRRRLTSKRDDRNLVRMSLADRHKNAKELMADWGANCGVHTVRRRLVASGLKARIPRKKPLLNVLQRQKRLNWAKAHLNWTLDQWKNVLWSDESKISIFGSDGLRFVRRRVGEELLPGCLTPTMKHPVSVMMWGCMTATGVGRLHVCNGIINGAKYIEILQTKMLSSARALFDPNVANPRLVPDFTFQQDNAPCHTSKLVKTWFQNTGVVVLEWPGNSPDLNPIENLWRRLKILVGKSKPSNRVKLIESILHAWNHVITPNELENLVYSMPRRCAAVIKSKGYPTKY